MEVRPEPIRSSWRLPTQLLVAVVLLAVAAVAVGASLAGPGTVGAPSVAAAAGAGASAAPAASPDSSAGPGWSNGKGHGMWPGMMGGIPGWAGAAGGRGNSSFLADITISAIDGPKVSLQSANGWSRTIDTTGVAITRAGTKIAVADLKVGDRVAIGETRGSTGTYTVNTLSVVLDRVAGTVSVVGADSITLKQGGSKTATVKTTATTVYRRAGQAVDRGSITVGQRLVAVGATAPDGSLTAEAVDVQPDVVFGTVTKKSGNTLTISTFGGGTATVQVTSSTTFSVAGKTSASLADVAVKDVIVAQGSLGADGVLNASTVRAGAWRTDAPSFRGHGPKAWPGTNGASPSPSAGTSG